MKDGYDEKKLSEIFRKQEKLKKERLDATKEIVKNLEEQKKIEKEHLDLVGEHLKYWMKEIERTNAIDKDRIIELEDRLKMEDRIYNKIKGHIQHIDKEIKFQKGHIH